MSKLDPSLQQLVGVLIILLGTINVWFLNKIRRDNKQIKKDTSQINNAVNHIGPGQKPMTQRVDRIEETLHTIQYEQDIAKQTAIKAKDLTENLSEKINQTNSMVEGLMSSHVSFKKQLDEMMKVIPKRKND